MCSNDSDFLEQLKKYSAYLAACNDKPKQIIRAFEKINNQTRSTVQQKRAKSKTKLVIFTTQYNPLGLNINSIIKKHLPIITDKIVKYKNVKYIGIFQFSWDVSQGFDVLCI